MVTTTTPPPAAKELVDALSRVAASPGMTRHLHHVLGGYCHQSRNLLNCLNMSLYLSRRACDPESASVWKDLEARYRHVEQFIDRIQAICRPMSVRPVSLPFALLVADRNDGWKARLGRTGRGLIVEPPGSQVVVAFDPVSLGQGFDELVNWRSEMGPPGSDLRIRWHAEEGHFRVTWDEPRRGPLAERRVASVATPGDILDALSIPLLTRIVSLHGGTLDETSERNWRVVVRWPIDLGTHER